MTKKLGIRVLATTLIAAGLGSQSASAQNVQIELKILDGKTGKPIEAPHLLVFGGETPDDVHLQKLQVNISSDKDGTSLLTAPHLMKWIQVWVDGATLCQKTPNLQAFDMAKIVSSGLGTPNTCSSIVMPLKPGQLIVFARARTLKEKMTQ